MTPSMTVLELAGEDGNWRLALGGDWALAAMAPIELELGNLSGGLQGPLACDWSRASSPGIGTAWALLNRLGSYGAGQLEVRHTGDPPHFLELLQKLQAERHAPPVAQGRARSLETSVGKLGRWAVLQGSEARAVIGFFGRII